MCSAFSISFLSSRFHLPPSSLFYFPPHILKSNKQTPVLQIVIPWWPHPFFTYTHKIILPTPLALFSFVQSLFPPFTPICCSTDVYWMCLHLKQIPDSVFSVTPTSPPLTFRTLAATLHLLFSALQVASFRLWLNVAANLPPVTSHKSPSLHTSLTSLSLSALGFLSSPSGSTPQPQRCDYTSTQPFRTRLTHNEHGVGICMSGAGAFHRGWDGWLERER